ncbi:hypothetical protein B296_00039556 [Ensete ventricosum]|uniref:Uncharacterized protein n=1 Tax=Ensete ventricosum TaxID=4639 RepID=A0A426Y2I8_ENSVE|nr:hypothetical protein B296_00039556 [Ensete ventricosum]
MASDTSADAAEVERLYEFGERLNEAKDKSEVPSPFFSHCFPALRLGALFPSLGFAFEALAKQLAAQLIPRFFKFFPSLSSRAVTALFDLVEEDDLGVRFCSALSLSFSFSLSLANATHLAFGSGL